MCPTVPLQDQYPERLFTRSDIFRKGDMISTFHSTGLLAATLLMSAHHFPGALASPHMAVSYDGARYEDARHEDARYDEARYQPVRSESSRHSGIRFQSLVGSNGDSYTVCEDAG